MELSWEMDMLGNSESKVASEMTGRPGCHFSHNSYLLRGDVHWSHWKVKPTSVYLCCGWWCEFVRPKASDPVVRLHIRYSSRERKKRPWSGVTAADTLSFRLSLSRCRRPEAVTGHIFRQMMGHQVKSGQHGGTGTGLTVVWAFF